LAGAIVGEIKVQLEPDAPVRRKVWSRVERQLLCPPVGFDPEGEHKSGQRALAGAPAEQSPREIRRPNYP
jgi:hypothetical protein